MLLIYPPVTRPCEPPAGIARLSAALKASGVKTSVLDANLEGLLHILQAPVEQNDTWSRRAANSRERHVTDYPQRPRIQKPCNLQPRCAGFEPFA